MRPVLSLTYHHLQKHSSRLHRYHPKKTSFRNSTKSMNSIHKVRNRRKSSKMGQILICLFCWFCFDSKKWAGFSVTAEIRKEESQKQSEQICFFKKQFSIIFFLIFVKCNYKSRISKKKFLVKKLWITYFLKFSYWKPKCN